MAPDPRFRYLYVIWAVLECLFFGGLLYGWGSLVFVLKEIGVYSEMCDDYAKNGSLSDDLTLGVRSSTISSVRYSIIGNGSYAEYNTSSPDAAGDTRQNLECPERDKRLTLVFTIGSMMFCAGCAVMGQINFKYGTRATRLCALMCFTLGGLLTGFTSHEVPWLIFPGLSLLGIGGIPLLMTGTQFSMLFTKGSSTVVALLSGSFDASSGVVLIFKLLHEQGISLRSSMLVITGAHFLTLISTFFFLPRGFISKARPGLMAEDAVHNEAGVELIGRISGHMDKTDKETEIEKEPKEETKCKGKKLPPIKSCIMSPTYYLHVIWLSILQLRFYYFLGSLNAWLNSMLNTKEEVSYFTNVCLFTMMCGFITSPMAGLVYDIHKRIFGDSRSQLRRDLMPAVPPLAFTSVLGIALSVLQLFDNPSVLYPTFIFNTVFRSFIYSMGAAYINVMFPSEYFGLLYGLMIILSGIISLAQYILFIWAETYGFTVPGTGAGTRLWDGDIPTSGIF
ncbi:equilibrative nucleobase transporter 1-like isoform X2 [Littorina saxatilis]|uniref:equilibrative nucleobase transporter 1-like isoform X2 n=1 Tax=Littorina saxatilis TaxID=31220 RepID=UPI0038B59A46